MNSKKSQDEIDFAVLLEMVFRSNIVYETVRSNPETVRGWIADEQLQGFREFGRNLAEALNAIALRSPEVCPRSEPGDEENLGPEDFKKRIQQYLDALERGKE